MGIRQSFEPGGYDKKHEGTFGSNTVPGAVKKKQSNTFTNKFVGGTRRGGVMMF